MISMKCIILWAVIISGMFSVGCDKDAGPIVWRASNDNGDKPGNGIELTLNGEDISGAFYLLDPEKPRRFDQGVRLPMSVERQAARLLLCEVQLNALESHKFVLWLPDDFPKVEFVAVTKNVKPETVSVEFRFKRVK